MTLSAIKSMFLPGTCWNVLTPYQKDGQPNARRVLKANSEIVWNQPSDRTFHTTWPAASEVIEARPGYLKFRYEHMEHPIEFILLEGQAAADAAATIRQGMEQAKADTQARKTREQEERKAAALAEIDALHTKLHADQDITSEELITLIRHHGIEAPPQTIGALRRKVMWTNSRQWAYRARNRPRFSYETQPSVLYEKLRTLAPAPANVRKLPFIKAA